MKFWTKFNRKKKPKDETKNELGKKERNKSQIILVSLLQALAEIYLSQLSFTATFAVSHILSFYHRKTPLYYTYILYIYV